MKSTSARTASRTTSSKYAPLTQAESFLEGRIEQLEVRSVAEAHVYLEFVRQMKDLHTKNFLKQTKEISKRLENYATVHDHTSR